MKKILIIAGVLACFFTAPLRADTASGNLTVSSTPVYTNINGGGWVSTVTTTTTTATATTKTVTRSTVQTQLSSDDAAVMNIVIAATAATLESGASNVTWTVTGTLAGGVFGPGSISGLYFVGGVRHTVGPVTVPAPSP